MGLVGTLLRGATSTVALGVGAAVAVPLALPVLTSHERRRNLAKKAIKRCLVLSDRVQESADAVRVQVNALVAEARAELEAEAKAQEAEPVEPSDAPDIVDPMLEAD